MARRRYHYDAKGRLKGYSSDKYIPRLRDLILIFGCVAVIGWFMGDADPQSQEELAASKAMEERLEEVRNRQPSPTEPSPSSTSIPTFSSEGGYNARPPQVDNQSSFERDLKPHYEAECVKGDQSACEILFQSR